MLTRLEKEEMQELINSTIESFLKNDKYKVDIQKHLKEAADTAMKDIIDEQNKKLQILEEKIRNLEKENTILQENIVRQEQYSRRNCVRIFGIQEDSGENMGEMVINLLTRNLNLKIEKKSSVLIEQVLNHPRSQMAISEKPQENHDLLL